MFNIFEMFNCIVTVTLPEVMLMDATVNIIVIVFIVPHAIIDLVNLVGILGVQPMQLKYSQHETLLQQS